MEDKNSVLENSVDACILIYGMSNGGKNSVGVYLRLGGWAGVR
jgi:hypothetical protein